MSMEPTMCGECGCELCHLCGGCTNSDCSNEQCTRDEDNGDEG